MSQNKVRYTFGTVEIINGGYMNVGNNQINNVADPLHITDGVNKQYVDKLNQSGDLKWSIKISDFNGWIICDGRSLSRTTYSELFDIIGTSFGTNSISTFNIPDCRGRTLGAIGNGSGLTSRSIGDVVGSETHTMSTNEMPSHTHTGTTSSNGSHTHTYNDAYFAEAGGNQVNGNNVFGTSGSVDTDNQFRWRNADGTYSATPTDITTSTNGNHNHTFTSDSTGNGVAFNIIQPTLFIGNVFIFTNVISN